MIGWKTVKRSIYFLLGLIGTMGSNSIRLSGRVMSNIDSLDEVRVFLLERDCVFFLGVFWKEG